MALCGSGSLFPLVELLVNFASLLLVVLQDFAQAFRHEPLQDVAHQRLVAQAVVRGDQLVGLDQLLG